MLFWVAAGDALAYAAHVSGAIHTGRALDAALSHIRRAVEPERGTFHPDRVQGIRRKPRAVTEAERVAWDSLHRKQGWTLREIAARYDRTIGAVQKHVAAMRYARR